MGYLTAFLNSKIFRFAFKEYFPELLGDTRELSKIFFETVSVIEVNSDTSIHFERLVEEISEKKANRENTFDLELKVEETLAAIYGLTSDELTLIDFSEGREAKINDLSVSESS